MFDAGTVEARLILDRDPFQRSLKAAREEGRAFARRVFSARLEANVAPVLAAVRSARSSAQGFARGSYEAVLGADLDPLRDRLATAASLLRVFSRGRHEARLTASTGAAEAATERAHRVGERYGRSSFVAKAGVDLSRVVSGFSSAKKQAEAWARENPEAAAGVDIGEVAAKMATARQLVRTFGQTTATKTVEVKVVDEIGRARRRIESLEKVVENASDDEVRIEAKANVRAARIRLHQLKQLARSVGLTDADIEAEVKVSGMERFRRAMGDIKSGLNSTRNKFNTTMYTMRNVADASMRAAAAAIIGSLGPGSAAVLTAGAGFSTIGIGFGLITLAAKETFRKVEVQNGKIVAKTGETLTESQKKLVNGLNRFGPAYSRAIKPANNVMNRLIGKAVKLGEKSMPFVGTVAEKTAKKVENAFDRVADDAREPGQLKTFRRFLNRVPGMTGKATEAIGSVGIGAINVLEKAQPHFDKWLDRGVKLANRFREWTQSPEGGKSIDKFLEENLPVIEDFASAAVKIARGIGRLGTSPGARALFGELAEVLGAAGDNLPALEPALRFMSRVIGKFNDMPPALQNLALQGAAYGFAFNALGGGFIVGIVGAVTKLLLVRGLFSRIKAIGDLSKYLKRMPAGGQGPGGAIPTTQKGGKMPPPVVPAPVPQKGFWGRFVDKIKRLRFPKGVAWRAAGGIGLVIVAASLANSFQDDANRLGRKIGDAVGTSAFGPWLKKKLKRLLGERLYEVGASILSFEFGPWATNLYRGFKERIKEKGWKSLGDSIVLGIMKGIAGKDTFLGKVLGVFRGLWKGVREWWGVKSPSTRAAKLGRDIVAGLLDGLTKAPLIGPFVGRLRNLYRDAHRAFREGGWRGLGAWAVGKIADGLRETPLGRLAGRIAGLYRGAREAFRKGGWRGLGAWAIGRIADGLKDTKLGQLASKVAALYRDAREAFREGGWRGLGSYAVSKIADGLRETKLGQLVARIAGLYRDAREAFREDGWRGLGAWAVSKIGEGLKETKLGQLVSRVADLFRGGREAFREKGWKGLGSFVVGKIGEGLKDTKLGQLVARIAPLFRDAHAAFKDKGWRGLGVFVLKKIGEGLKDTPLGQLLARVGPLFSGGREALRKRGWSGLGAYVIGKIGDGLKDTQLGQLLGKLADLYSSAKNKVGQMGWGGIGKAVVQGIASGIEDASGVVAKAIGWLASHLPDWAKKALGISSPSKVFREQIGRNIGESWALGIEDKAARIRSAAEKTARAAAAAASGAYSPELRADVGRIGVRGLSGGAYARRTAPMHRTTNHTIGDVSVHIHQAPGQSAPDVAREVEKVLRELQGDSKGIEAYVAGSEVM